LNDQEAVLMRTFASAHTVLRLEGGEFVSLTDPPNDCQQAAAGCQNLGTWPVLVGDESKGERDTLLSSPIILPDYPQIAPESNGDLFDGTEIDEILTLRIQTMTDEEKMEMRTVDEHARRLLERADNATGQDMLKLHGVMREGRSFDDQIFGTSKPLEGVSFGETYLQPGDKVRICPKSRADVMDMALAGKTGIIEAIEQDAEDRVQLGLVLQDDPGMDLGMLRQPGHRFFYTLDEIEPLEKGE
jgi:hydrogenase maturation protease